MQYLILIMAWALFGVVHSALATTAVKRVAMRVMKGSYKYYRLFYSLLAAASLAWVLHIHFSISEPILWRPPFLQGLLGAILVIAGLVVMLVCIRKYFFFLSGIDAVMQKTAPVVLQQDGMHKYVRHPLYSGTLLFVWAIFIGYPYLDNLLSVVCITLYTWIGMQYEERKLVAAFGDAYRQYRARVPALLPVLFFK